MHRVITLIIFVGAFVGEAFAQRLFVNEILASNNQTSFDEDGESSDWIEIFNADSVTVNLDGFTLTDDPANPALWTFPAVTIDSGGHFIIWASDKNRAQPDGELHANFKLKSSGEYVGIYDPNGDLIDGVTFGSQTTDVSYGRIPDGENNFDFFSAPTPGTANSGVANGGLLLEFSHDQGVYADTLDLVLTTDIPGGEIRYAIGGDVPVDTSFLYIAPIDVDSSMVVRAQVFVQGAPQTEVETRLYIIDDDPSLPVLSIVTAPENLFDPETGIYENYEGRGMAWERPAHMTLIENGETQFALDFGLRMHGFYTRRLDKKSFRAYFRSEYGSSTLNAQLFPEKDIRHFKRLVIHSGGQDQVTDQKRASLIRNPLAVQLWLDMGVDQGHVSMYKPVSMYLNGEYWGLYWLRERIDDHFLDDNFSIKDADLQEIIRETYLPEVKVGDDAFWQELWDFLAANDLSGSAEFEAFENKYIEVDNFISYQILEMYMANFDWPHFNLYRFRDRSTAGKFKYILWDTDQAFHLFNQIGAEHNTAAWATRDQVRTDLNWREDPGGSWLWSTVVMRELLANQEFKRRFIDEFLHLNFTVLHKDHVLDRIDEFEEMIEDEIERETDRWKEGTVTKWRNNLGIIRTFARNRGAAMTGHIAEALGLTAPVKLTIEAPYGNGEMRVNSVSPKRLPWSGDFFPDIPVELTAIAGSGFDFLRWSDNDLPHNSSLALNLEKDKTLRAVFTDGSLNVIGAEATNVRPETATILAESDYPTKAFIEYGVSNAYGKTTRITDSFEVNHVFYLSDLTPKAEHHFRVHVEREDGTKSTSNDLVFTTLAPDTIPPVFSNVEVQALAWHTVSVSWQTDELARGGVEYDTTQAFTQKLSSDSLFKFSDTLSVRDLDEKTRYFFRIFSRDTTGNLGRSEIVELTTPVAPDTIAPEILEVLLQDVTWRQAAVVCSTNERTKALLTYHLDQDTTQQVLSLDSLSVVHRFSLTGLAHDTTYFGRITVTDSSGNAAESALFDFRTAIPPDTIPPLIFEEQIAEITFDKASIFWSTNEPTAGNVEYGLDSLLGQISSPDSALKSEHEITLSNLLPDAPYFYRSVARDSSGNVALSALRKFRTLTAPDTTAPQIIELSIIDTAATSADIRLQTDEPAKIRFIYGLTIALPDTAKSDDSWAVSHAFSLNPLVSDTLYFAKITFEDSVGNSGTSDLMTFRTQPLATSVLGGEPPQSFSVSSAFPNPFNAQTRLRIDIPEAGRLSVQVFDLHGKKTAELFQNNVGAGREILTWDGRNHRSVLVSSGVYLIFIEYKKTGGDIERSVRRIVLLK